MSMARFVVRRVLEILVTLFIVATLIFILFRMMPGNPTAMVLSPRMTPEVREIVRSRFGLDKPLWQQYFIYLNNILHGEFGNSFY
ncbi:MAG: ABC transporter permease [Theionarchaea archaeon]|nr:ABC transporter permease [Theionarchaea archaeon]